MDSVFAFVFYFIRYEELFSIPPRSQSDYTRDPSDGAARLKTTFCETVSVDLQSASAFTDKWVQYISTVQVTPRDRKDQSTATSDFDAQCKCSLM